jgi:hypothetical protein
MAEKIRTPYPAGLSLAGKRVWKSVVSYFDLRPDELFLLESAAKTADTIASLDAALVGQPLIVKGSMGQEREHPLLSEVRQQRTSLARLLGQLKLPDTDDLGVTAERPAARSSAARKAANARWADRWKTGG